MLVQSGCQVIDRWHGAIIVSELPGRGLRLEMRDRQTRQQRFGFRFFAENDPNRIWIIDADSQDHQIAGELRITGRFDHLICLPSSAEWIGDIQSWDFVPNT